MADMFLQVCQRWLMAWLLSGCAWVHLGADLPNILWITSEDNGPHLGCYGDTYAHTPNLDALAAKGVKSGSTPVRKGGDIKLKQQLALVCLFAEVSNSP